MPRPHPRRLPLPFSARLAVSFSWPALPFLLAAACLLTASWGLRHAWADPVVPAPAASEALPGPSTAASAAAGQVAAGSPAARPLSASPGLQGPSPAPGQPGALSDPFPFPADLTLPVPGSYSRIVSLAPSLTETLFALGLGGQVVGVTDFCSFPPEVKAKTRIGGFIDPNIELIIGLRPDLVVLLPDHREMKIRLEGMGIRCLAVPQYTVQDILASLIIVGTACGVRDHARDVRRAIAHDLHLIRQAIKDRPPVRAILAVGRDLTGDRLDQACLAGPKGYLSDLLTRAGGVNAVTETVLTYPSVSREGLAALAPEVVIDLIPDPDRQKSALDTIRQAWREVPGLPAARTGRIHILDTDFAAIPGPRVAEVVRTFARLLHPDLQ